MALEVEGAWESSLSPLFGVNARALFAGEDVAIAGDASAFLLRAALGFFLASPPDSLLFETICFAS